MEMGEITVDRLVRCNSHIGSNKGRFQGGHYCEEEWARRSSDNK
jgi:hypothetical protein